MRARVYSNGGNSTGGFTFNGGTLTGALFLAGNPSELLEAASKQYIDSSLVNLNAGNITSGILPSGRLPSFVGDLVKPAGSSTINLAPNGIVAGDYIKPTVDAKGRVTGGSSLIAADIPNLSWNKITNGKPTTLSGYGITDAISLSGGSLNGFLSFNGTIGSEMQAVTKQYVDVTLSSASGIAIGDIIRKPYNTTPPGFLKCNGAEVDKTTYSTLYSVIGDRFSNRPQFTGGMPWRYQYSFNDSQSSTLNNWTSTITAPQATHGINGIFVTKNRVYIAGGWGNVGGVVSTVYYAPINADGSLGSWVSTTNLPITTLGHSIVVGKNRVYLIGGHLNADGTSTDMSFTVYSAVINADGSIGTWTAISTLPAAHFVSNAFLTNSKLYLVGGALNNIAGSQTNRIYSCNVNSDGTLGTWTTEANAPFYKVNYVLIVTKNRVYACGGEQSLYTNTITSTVFTAPINADGTLGTWVSTTALPYGVSGSAVFVTKNRAYIIGGTLNSGYTSSIISASINVDGTLGTWEFSGDLPSPRAAGRLCVTKNKLYYIAGFGNSGSVNTIFVNAISGGLNDYSPYYAVDNTNYMMPGVGRPWQQQYEINSTQNSNLTNWTATTSLPANLYGSTIIVTKNRVYTFGGYNGSAYISTVYTAPINGDGTLGTWSTSTSLPANLAFAQAIITKNRVHVIGGENGSTALSTVYTAPINADGSLGTWSTGTSLTTGLGWSQVAVIKNRIFLVGGSNRASATSHFLSAPINSDGTLGTWSAQTGLPVNVHSHCLVATKNRLYFLGGFNAGGSATNNFYTATVTSDGVIGSWTSVGTLPLVIGYSQAFVTANRVYLIGGSNGSSNHTVIWSAPITTDGTIGTFVAQTDTLPFSGYYHSIFATNGRLYWVGGILQPGTPSPAIYFTSILGGSNDYSPYYDGTITPAVVVNPSTTFALPDLTNSEKFDTVSYIKY